jgi:hypothetical protein
VTRDESQVSVGGLLALDQFFRVLGHIRPIFGDFDRLSKEEHKTKKISQYLDPFLGIFGFWDYVTDMGMSAYGFTHV